MKPPKAIHEKNRAGIHVFTAMCKPRLVCKILQCTLHFSLMWCGEPDIGLGFTGHSKKSISTLTHLVTSFTPPHWTQRNCSSSLAPPAPARIPWAGRSAPACPCPCPGCRTRAVPPCSPNAGPSSRGSAVWLGCWAQKAEPSLQSRWLCKVGGRCPRSVPCSSSKSTGEQSSLLL